MVYDTEYAESVLAKHGAAQPQHTRTSASAPTTATVEQARRFSTPRERPHPGCREALADKKAGAVALASLTVSSRKYEGARARAIDLQAIAYCC